MPSTSTAEPNYWWDPDHIALAEDNQSRVTSTDESESESGKETNSSITFKHPRYHSSPLNSEDQESSSDEEPSRRKRSFSRTGLPVIPETSEDENENIENNDNGDNELDIDHEPPPEVPKKLISSTLPPELYFPGIDKYSFDLKIHSTNENLTYHRDNYLHFISADCEFPTIISQLLIDTDKIDPQGIKFKKPRRKQVIVSENGKFVTLSAVLTDRHFDNFSVHELKEVLRTVHDVIKEYSIETLRISKPGDMLETWSKSHFTEILEECLADCKCDITICYGSVTTPPEENRTDIIKEYHDSLVGGHKGITKTYHRIRERFTWPNLKTEVTEYIKSCPSCQERKLERIKTREPMIITDTPAEPFDKISIDTVGPLPRTPSNNQHILTIQDNLTKYCIAVPIPDIKAETIADALARNVIIQFGAPRVILSDQGRSFVGKVFYHLAKIFHIKQVTTSGYHPQTNGSLERSHIVLTEFIKHYVEKFQDWDKLVPFAMFSYNTSKHESTNFTPFELIYGKTARIPSSFPPTEKLETYNSYLVELINRMEDMRQLASKNLNISKHRSKYYYDKKLKPVQFQSGDKAYLLKEPRKGKFDSHYKGPYKIIKVLEINTAILENQKGERILKHLDKLKKFHERDDDSSSDSE